ncbi:FAD-binding protein [Massilia sp. MB5]|uniref:D-arabinono-1,4-lactone oxidase n=1 Tax=Massilia sp. MB5 TaxID=2919578 RepID=UPI001F1158AA|nr:D-arabinono-1,4-lactone oxidase [Massilia sp. MB5]UMR29774.1 FAD-binding protein [Massilia sp. MB5]
MTQTSRRRFLEATAAGMAATLLPGCVSRSSEPQMPVPYELGKPLPWVNWAGNQHCLPAQRLGPATEAEVVDILRQAKGVVRAVGSSHSFSGVVPTGDTLVATDLLSGLASHDAQTLQAELWGGTRLHDVGPLLESVGQALSNMPDMDYPSLAGSIATSVHGTGPRFGSLSNYVVGLTLATPSGELLDCSATQNAEIFNAVRTSLGALGIVTRIRMQNQAAFQLTEVNRIEKTEDVLADLDKRMAQHRHFEFLPLPHSDFCVTVATDPAKPGDSKAGEDDPQVVLDLRKIFNAVSWMPNSSAVYDWFLKTLLGGAGSTINTGPSYKVFPHVRVVRFREMEYTVPLESGPACVREILKTMRDKKIPVCFPLEYRHVGADDIWLSMFEGQPGASISVHQFGDTDYRPYFAEIEPIFWKYKGRPHWGKIHTLDAPRLSALYSRHWKDFHEVRRSLDPQSKMLNAHLKHIFGA